MFGFGARKKRVSWRDLDASHTPTSITFLEKAANVDSKGSFSAQGFKRDDNNFLHAIAFSMEDAEKPSKGKDILWQRNRKRLVHSIYRQRGEKEGRTYDNYMLTDQVHCAAKLL